MQRKVSFRNNLILRVQVRARTLDVLRRFFIDSLIFSLFCYYKKVSRLVGQLFIKNTVNIKGKIISMEAGHRLVLFLWCSKLTSIKM